MTKLFKKETEVVSAFMAWLEHDNYGEKQQDGWVVYAETGGWDLLLAHRTKKIQIGIEAKLRLNAKVLAQSLPQDYYPYHGPDYRAVLVPGDSCQLHMADIAGHLGITVITIDDDSRFWGEGTEPKWRCSCSNLPKEVSTLEDRGWFPWLPIKRVELPDYIPDVLGGDKSPVALTPWKIKAIKLMILLERRGVVHRSDMQALDISPSRWTDHHHGFLKAAPAGYVRCDRTPDLKAQHPKNWDEIEADFDKWAPQMDLDAAE